MVAANWAESDEPGSKGHNGAHGISRKATTRPAEKCTSDATTPVTSQLETTTRTAREGETAAAIQRKLENGTLKVTPGGYEDAVQSVVDLWQQRREARACRQFTTMGHSGSHCGPSADELTDFRATG